MPSLGDIRGGLTDALSSVDGLRVERYVESTIEPPVAVIGFPTRIDYDRSMGRGLDEYVIPVRVYVASAINRVANDALEEHIDAFKGAVEADGSLAGLVADTYVEAMTGAGVIEVGGLSYLAADWEVHVFAEGV